MDQADPAPPASSSPAHDTPITAPVPATAAAANVTAYHLNANIARQAGAGIGDSRDGAYTRKWLNQEVTPVLLDGMRYLAREKPVDPVRALGQFLLQRAEQRYQEDIARVSAEDQHGAPAPDTQSHSSSGAAQPVKLEEQEKTREPSAPAVEEKKSGLAESDAATTNGGTAAAPEDTEMMDAPEPEPIIDD